jgi:ferritin-like metal-binding protein YciE
MSGVDSLRTLLSDQLSALYDAEKRLARAVSALADVATDVELQAALDGHAAETDAHVARLEQVFDELDTLPPSRTCLGIQTLIEEGLTHLRSGFASGELLDAAIIGVAQRLEHYEIAAYGTAAAHARLLELHPIAELIEQTLDDEKAMDRTLTAIALASVNAAAATGVFEVAGRGVAGRRAAKV